MLTEILESQTGIRVGHATDLSRTAISDVGTAAHFYFKSGIWRTLGVKPDVAWRAVSDAVFSVTFFPVIVDGQIVQALLHQRKLSTGPIRSKEKYQNGLDQGVKESPEIF